MAPFRPVWILTAASLINIWKKKTVLIVAFSSFKLAVLL